MIIRNEDKFRKRNKSHRCVFETEVLRDDIIQIVIRARNYLLMRKHVTKDSFLDLDSFGTLRSSRTSSFDLLRAIGEEVDEYDEGVSILEDESEKEVYTDSDVLTANHSLYVDSWYWKELCD